MMIYIHKLFPALLSPIMLIVAFILLGLILKKSFIVWAAIIVLIIGSMPIVTKSILHSLESNQIRLSVHEIQSADAIVVLSGMLTSVETSQGIDFEWVDPDRFLGGVELLIANRAPYLIFTGGRMPWQKNMASEGEFLKKQTIIYGISQQHVLVTNSAQNTEEEARAVKALLDETLGTRPKRIILVTSAFHMSRAKHLFASNGLIVTTYPVDFKADISDLTPMSFIPTAIALRDLELAYRELLGRIYYSTVWNLYRN